MCELCLRKSIWLEPELLGGAMKDAWAGRDGTTGEGDPLPAAAAADDVVLDAPSPYEGSPTSSLPSSGDGDIDNLLATGKWGDDIGTGVVVTYSFPSFGAVWKAGYGSDEPASFQPLSATQQAAVRDALELWSDLANITFVEVQETASEVGTIRFGRSDVPSTAWAYYPSSGYPEGGDVWLGPIYGTSASYAPGTYNFATLMHEIGHAIGLKHPHSTGGSGVVYPTSADWLGNSVMSYRSYIGDGLTGYSNPFFPTTPMLNDVAAIQYMYGANLQTRAGDTTYAWAPGQRLFETIYDAGGSDTIDWSSQGSAAVINLAPGSWSELGPAYTWNDGTSGSYKTTLAIAEGTWIENARGGSAGDRITGNALGNRLEGNGGADHLLGAAGADSLLGGDGDDSLDGGGGSDRLWGGAGNDSFVFAGSFGDDVVHDTLGSNRIVLGDLAQGAVSLVNVGGDLLIEVIGGSDSILVEDYFASSLVYDLVYGATAAPTTLVGTDGNDTLSGGAGSETIWGNGGADRIYGNGGDDTAYGGTGSDSLFGGDGLDWLFGDGGIDRLHGGLGRDVIAGGGGSDVFDFDAVAESLPGAGQRDVISDFKVKQSDRIDLAGIDANPATGGDDSFSWRGTSGFSADATGQLRYFKSGGVTVIQASTDADATPELEIELTGSITLQSSYFLL
jgi:serralysin